MKSTHRIEDFVLILRKHTATKSVIFDCVTDKAIRIYSLNHILKYYKNYKHIHLVIGGKLKTTYTNVEYKQN